MITEQDGKNFAWGAASALLLLWIIGLACVGSISLVANATGWGTDSTDVNGWQRSGLRIHRDAQTGIEYLSDGKGGLVRREYR